MLRVKTSRTLRSIDNWKKRFDLRNHRFLAAMSLLILAASCSSGDVLILAFIILGVSVHYAAMQFAVLMLIGFLSAKLHMYRLTNTILRGLHFSKTLAI
jgi:hypothetical protein